MKIGLETESMHLWFQSGRMDIFEYIDFAHELGLDGVIINIIRHVRDKFIDEEWGCLGGANDEHLQKIKAKLDEYHMYCEIDTNGFDLQKFEKIAKVAQVLEAEIIRTYVLPSKYKEVKNGQGSFCSYYQTYINFDTEVFLESAEEIKALIPLLEKYNLKLAVENHEYETADELLTLIKAVNHPRVGFLYDFGNSMMAYEDPLEAASKMAPHVFTTHCKDHIIFHENTHPIIAGVPLGDGNLDIKALVQTLKDYGLKRINIEQCFPYCATFKRTPGTGGIKELGKGAFKIHEPLFKEMKAMQYYYPQEISEELLEKMLKLQKEGCIRSATYLKNIIKELA